MPLQYPSLDAAIGTAEGYGKPGTIPTLANNPGDIIVSPFATSQGAIGSITAAGGQQIAVFPSGDAGSNALDALVQTKVSSGNVASLSDLAQSWLGKDASAADVNNYANTLATALGVPASTPVSSLGGGSPTGSTSPTSGGILSGIASSVGDMASFSLFGLPLNRAAAFFLGLIVIAGALLLFKPTQQIVVGAAKKGRDAVVAGAVA